MLEGCMYIGALLKKVRAEGCMYIGALLKKVRA